jgi:fatty acid-binding protein DegV
MAGRRSTEPWFCLDSLEYLRRGGRIGAARALVGSALQVKPILTFETEVVPVGRVRTRRRAFERMVATGERAGRSFYVFAAVGVEHDEHGRPSRAGCGGWNRSHARIRAPGRRSSARLRAPLA